MRLILDWAKSGNRVAIDKKVVWKGLGNRSGLHEYAEKEIDQAWSKSGRTFERKVRGLPPGTLVELLSFRNTNRDRGTWNLSKAITIELDPISVKPESEFFWKDIKSNDDAFTLILSGVTLEKGVRFTSARDVAWELRPGDKRVTAIVPKGSQVTVVSTSSSSDLGPSIRLRPELVIGFEAGYLNSDNTVTQYPSTKLEIKKIYFKIDSNGRISDLPQGASLEPAKGYSKWYDWPQGPGQKGGDPDANSKYIFRYDNWDKLRQLLG